MVVNLIDKILFALLLLIFLQVPIFTAQYLQYLVGYHSALAEQIERYENNARQNAYSSVQQMIDDFKRNANPAVKADALQKEDVIREAKTVAQGIAVLRNGNVIAQAQFVIQPAQWARLKAVLKNFEPGIPIRPMLLVYSLVAALLAGGVLCWPLKYCAKKMTGRHRSLTKQSHAAQPESR